MREWVTAFPISQPKLMPNCSKIDSTLKKVIKICRKSAKEVDIGKEELIWFDILDMLFDMKLDPKVSFKRFCREYF